MVERLDLFAGGGRGPAVRGHRRGRLAGDLSAAPQLARPRQTVLVLDPATFKALDVGVPPVRACLIGMLTAIGGGPARDLLTGGIPIVGQRDIGAVAVAILDRVGMAPPLPPADAAFTMIAVRVVALRRRWSAPIAVP